MTHVKRINIPGVFISLLLWTVIVSGQGKDTIQLISIPKVGPPNISSDTIRITVNFIFNHSPSDYWLHYNKAEKRLIFEFIGVHLGETNIEIHGTDILSDLKIQNSRSDFALNKKISRLSMSMDEGWHYESWTITSKIIRLQIYALLNPGKNLKNKNKKAYALILGIIFSVAAGTFGVSTWIHEVSK